MFFRGETDPNMSVLSHYLWLCFSHKAPLQSHSSQLYYSKSTMYLVLIIFSRMIWWRTRHSPGTPTDGSILSVASTTQRSEAKQTPKEDQCRSEKSVCLNAAEALQMSSPLWLSFGSVMKMFIWFHEKSFKWEISEVLFSTFPLNFQRSSVWWKFFLLSFLRGVNSTSAPLTDSSCMHSTLMWHEWSQCPLGDIWGHVAQCCMKSSTSGYPARTKRVRNKDRMRILSASRHMGKLPKMIKEYKL